MWKILFFLKMPTLSLYSFESASTHLGQGLSHGCLHPATELEAPVYKWASSSL